MEAQMQHRFKPIFCSAFLFIAAGNPGVAANDNDPPAARADVLSPAALVSCSPGGPADKPLDPPVTSSVPRDNRFVAAEHFKEDISPAADVRISWLGANFSQRFAVKIEDEVGAITLRTYNLTRPANDNEIIAALKDRHETSLAEVWCLLRRHASGQGGGLRSDVVPNLFFIRDVSGKLGVVDVIWGGAGWEIGASEVGEPRQWPNGCHVIVRQ
jgi:hypothetical protein